MTIRRAAAISIGLALSWPFHAAGQVNGLAWETDYASISMKSECQEGNLNVLREPDGYGGTYTRLGYSLNDTCDPSKSAYGVGLIPNDTLTGSGKTALHLVADPKTMFEVFPEGADFVIDMTWEPIDGDFSVSRDSGRGSHQGVISKFRGFSRYTDAKVTGSTTLFEPTEAEMGWSLTRRIEVAE